MCACVGFVEYFLGNCVLCVFVCKVCACVHVTGGVWSIFCMCICV